MYTQETLEQFKSIQTPFYCYDLPLLRKTAEVVRSEAAKYDFHVHYAMKANCDDRILQYLSSVGFGADCVALDFWII